MKPLHAALTAAILATGPAAAADRPIGAATPSAAPTAEVSVRVAAVWNRPSTEGHVEQLLMAHAVVELLDTATNDRGLWWYVDTGTGTGWLRDSDFGGVQPAQRRQVSLRPQRPDAGAYCQRNGPGARAQAIFTQRH